MWPFRPDGGNGDDDEYRQFRFDAGDDDEDLTEGERELRDILDDADSQEERPEAFDERRTWDSSPSRADADPHYYALHFMGGIPGSQSRHLLNEYQDAARVVRLAKKYPAQLRDLPGVGDRTIARLASMYPLDLDAIRQERAQDARKSHRSREERAEMDPDQPDLGDATANYSGPPDEPPIPEEINRWRYEETDSGGQFMWLAPESENDPRRAQDGIEVIHSGSKWYVRTLTRRAQGQATLSGIEWRYGNYQSLRFSPDEGAEGMRAAFERARQYMERHDPPGEWPDRVGETSASRSYHREMAEWAASGNWRVVETGATGYAWKHTSGEVLSAAPVDRRSHGTDDAWTLYRNDKPAENTYSGRMNALRAARVYMEQDAREGGRT